MSIGSTLTETPADKRGHDTHIVGKAMLERSLARPIEFVPCPPLSCQKSIEAGTAWRLNVMCHWRCRSHW